MKKPKPIAHVDRLARALSIGERQLRELASLAGGFYHPRSITIRGKERTIDRPVGRLKRLQRLIYERLLMPIVLPAHVQGAVKGRSHMTNAAKHLGARKVASTDIRKCFPSISYRRVFQVWLHVCGHGPEVASILTKLTTYRGHLPQGASSSATLANLALLGADKRIQSMCSGRIVYTRYIDDLVMSGSDVDGALTAAAEILTAEGFRIARNKTGVVSRDGRQQVTGHTINSGRLSAPRWRDSQVRSAIHRLNGLRPSDPLFAQEVRRIEGKIRHIRVTNPARADYLQAYLGANWPAVGESKGPPRRDSPSQVPGTLRPGRPH